MTKLPYKVSENETGIIAAFADRGMALDFARRRSAVCGLAEVTDQRGLLGAFERGKGAGRNNIASMEMPRSLQC